MASISRRSFLKRSGARAATAGLAGVMASVPDRALVARRPSVVHSDGVAAPAGRAAGGPLVVHIPDPASGEVQLMFGTREVVRNDHALVALLVRDSG